MSIPQFSVVTDFTGFSCYPLINNKVADPVAGVNQFTPAKSKSQFIPYTPTSQPNNSQSESQSSSQTSQHSPPETLLPQSTKKHCSNCHGTDHNKGSCKNEPYTGSCSKKNCNKKKQQTKEKVVLKPTDANWADVVESSLVFGLNGVETLNHLVKSVKTVAEAKQNNKTPGTKRSRIDFNELTSYFFRDSRYVFSFTKFTSKQLLEQ